MDESLLPVADELYSIPWTPDPNEQVGQEKRPAILLPTGTDGADGDHVGAPNMRQTFGASGQNGARGGKTNVMDCHVASVHEIESPEPQGAGVA